MTQRLSGTLATLVLISASIGTSSTALARPFAPGRLQSDLGMPCAPACTVCHLHPQGGVPANKPLAVSLKEHGLDIFNESSLDSALQALEAEGTDSDEDGTPDITELKAGQDPDVKGSQSLCGPEYGCARVDTRGRVDGPAALSAAGVLLAGIAVLRRRARARRR